ncbi:MAG: four helix bundle protein [Marinilabiliaceae bacterium]|jgi:four helix bundle protein|nr:four helix bundle protein [Marinilabiliaceae bacterium]
MDNKEFSRGLEKRTRLFASKILKLAAKLPETPEANVIRYQLSKAGTSIGANYREANRARSRADFINKIRLCEAESSETVYWLEVILDQIWFNRAEQDPELKEANELLAIFTSIGTTTRNSNKL